MVAAFGDSVGESPGLPGKARVHSNRLITLCCVLLFGCMAATPQEDGKQWIERVARAYQELSSYQCEGVILSEFSGLQSGSRTTSFMRHSKPRENKFRYSAGMGDSRCVVASDGLSAIAYIGATRQYLRKQLTKPDEVLQEIFKGEPGAFIGGALPGEYLNLPSRCASAKVLRREALDLQSGRVDCVVVEAEMAATNTLPLTRTVRTLWIDPEKLMVLRDVTRTDAFSTQKKKFYDASQEVKLTSCRINQEIDESIFRFEPPSSAYQKTELNLPAVDDGLALGPSAESIPLTDVNGTRYSFKELRGSVVILDFWATWCGPCLKEMASLEKIRAKYKDKGLVIFGVNQQEQKIQTDFLKKKSFSYPMLLDRSGMLTRQFRASELPTLVVIDRNGRMANWEQGMQKQEELESLIKLTGIQ